MTNQEAIDRIERHMFHHRGEERRAIYITEALQMAIEALKAQDAKWISVKERLPDEHDSIFAGRAQLSKYLWSKESDNVNVYVEFPDGTGRVTEGRLQDGKWWTRISPLLNPVVTHWKPLPTPPSIVTSAAYPADQMEHRYSGLLSED